MFQTELWSVYSATIAGRPRSNNQTESWHAQFASNTGEHPDPLGFVKALHKETALYKKQITDVQTGVELPGPRKYWRERERERREI